VGRKLVLGLAVTVTVFVVGLLGAWAFNPNNGALAHNETIWRLFGIPAELAWVAIPLLVIVLLAWLVAQLFRRGPRLSR
jgi:heme/copper-type cytochrome/quinol oxidase subunit 2